MSTLGALGAAGSAAPSQLSGAAEARPSGAGGGGVGGSGVGGSGAGERFVPGGRTLDEQIGGRKLTPMLVQYVEAKRAAPADAILLFRLGDFYELFFDDARIAARELDLTLTSRDKDAQDPVPMAGVPHHAVEGYIARLVERGFSVAVCDQMEDPKQAKGIVKRDITRVVTPGTVSELEALDPGAATYLAWVQRMGAGASGAAGGDAQAGASARPGESAGSGDDGYIVAMLDLLAGELLLTRCPSEHLADELQRMGVREVLTHERERDSLREVLAELRLPVRVWMGEPPGELDVGELHGGELGAGELGASQPSNLSRLRQEMEERFGTTAIAGRQEPATPAELEAVLSVVRFAESTQRRRLQHLMAPRAYLRGDYLLVDEATRRNLELVRTLDGQRRASLLWHLDRCRTAIGSRTLSQWLLFPLRDKLAIETRLDMVGAMIPERSLREALQHALDEVRDIERLVGRVAVGRAHPKDLASLRNSLRAVPALQEQLTQHGSPLGRRWQAADLVPEARKLLDSALVEEPPTTLADGGVFRRGYRPDLDELITLSTQGHDFLAQLEARERERTKIPKLKVRFNKVFGYYIEVSRASTANVPSDYVRKQTLVNAERYITPELKEYETRVLGADEQRKTREQELFAELVEAVAGFASRLRNLSRLVATTDVVLSLAQVADEGRYTRPVLVDEPVLQLRQCRHPVVERLMPGGERFVPNDVDVDAKHRQLLILTGPNMAGKSTVMRQVALCTLLAHMGCYVPAKAARIGLADRVFTRVGASDNLGRGHSTFMVEMIETATILRDATERSLVILDEIGRGTSTFDGVSIAWAVAEHLHDRVGCRALFATHYHELTDLAVERPRIVNVSVAVKEEQGRVVFLRQLVERAADRSYGIEVARLAGLPDSVLSRSREILANLERGELDEAGMPRLSTSRGAGKRRSAQLALFGPATTPPDADPQPSPQSSAQPLPREPSPVEQALKELDPLHMTPIEALAALDRLRKLVQ